MMEKTPSAIEVGRSEVMEATNGKSQDTEESLEIRLEIAKSYGP